MFTKLAALLSIPLLAIAAPSGFSFDGTTGPLARFGGCSLSGASITFPADQTALAVPAGQVPTHILLGTGVQNYTCSAAGTYASAGAVAKLYDISCLYGTPEFPKIQDDWFNLPANVKKMIQAGLDRTRFYVADHYFVTNPLTGTGISPKFATAKTGSSFIIAAKAAGIPAADKTNVDWLELTNIQGDLAKTVFRVDTKSGQPPASCTPGSAPISVPYATKYWLYS